MDAHCFSYHSAAKIITKFLFPIHPCTVMMMIWVGTGGKYAVDNDGHLSNSFLLLYLTFIRGPINGTNAIVVCINKIGKWTPFSPYS